MKIAILGSSSRIAADFVSKALYQPEFEFSLFARDIEKAASFIACPIEYVSPYSEFTSDRDFDAIINFVGKSSPGSRTAAKNTIRQTNREFDSLALNYIEQHNNCRYVYMSSGAALGSNFQSPADARTPYSSEMMDEYSSSKQETEHLHRTFANRQIIDIRIFSYFHRSQDLSNDFFLSNLVRSIRSQSELIVDPHDISRDYLGADDFSRLVTATLNAETTNFVVDAYSRAPISKFQLLDACADRFSLKFRINSDMETVAPGRFNYYSLARSADVDYTPQKSSLENVLFEIEAIVSQ